MTALRCTCSVYANEPSRWCERHGVSIQSILTSSGDWITLAEWQKMMERAHAEPVATGSRSMTSRSMGSGTTGD